MDRETNGAVRKFEVCDNVDLEMMLLEFESYHYIKYQKYPKVVRKVTAGMKPPRRSVREAGSLVGRQTSVLYFTPHDGCVCVQLKAGLRELFHRRGEVSLLMIPGETAFLLEKRLKLFLSNIRALLGHVISVRQGS